MAPGLVIHVIDLASLTQLVFTTRCYAERGIAMASYPSINLSVTIGVSWSHINWRNNLSVASKMTDLACPDPDHFGQPLSVLYQK